ncbi:MAG: ABC transporter substrate-binding protein [Bacillota bacterium]|nr:ABC transporter substrate-binding protein [Bacillota bacterium]
MKKFLAVLLSLAMVFTFAACGEEASQGGQDADVIKIGVMQFGEFTALQNAFEGFKEGLADAGFVDGENIKINYLSAAADTANCPTIAETLINDGSDLIFAIATPSVSCVKEKTTDIPILFTAVTDPVASGILADANNPGGNISGTSDMNPVAEQIDLLKELLPNAQKVAVMYCSSESNSAAQFELAKAQIESLGMQCVQQTVSAIDEVKSAIESLAGKVDAIYIPTDNTLADGMTLVSATANECGIPTIVGEPGQVENGGTATFGIDYFELGKQTAAMAVEILNAEDPLAAVAAMPVGFQTKDCVTAINQAGIDALGLEVPQSILDRAQVF